MGSGILSIFSIPIYVKMGMMKEFKSEISTFHPTILWRIKLTIKKLRWCSWAKMSLMNKMKWYNSKSILNNLVLIKLILDFVHVYNEINCWIIIIGICLGSGILSIFSIPIYVKMGMMKEFKSEISAFHPTILWRIKLTIKKLW